MCLVGVAFHASERFPLVIAANRDEFLARPTAPLDAWDGILGGRDLQAGGTWLGATAAGRIALVTNVRGPDHVVPPGAPSRGEIVRYWLRGDATFDELANHVTLSGFAGVNVLAYADERFEHFSNHGPPRTELLRGIHGLSNASIDTPWPKVEKLKSRLAAALASANDESALVALLFDALADTVIAPDELLPNTGVGLEMERNLSPALIQLPQVGYGTRSSTAVVRAGHALTIYERTHGPGGGERRVTIDPWPLPPPR